MHLFTGEAARAPPAVTRRVRVCRGVRVQTKSLGQITHNFGHGAERNRFRQVEPRRLHLPGCESGTPFVLPKNTKWVEPTWFHLSPQAAEVKPAWGGPWQGLQPPPPASWSFACFRNRPHKPWGAAGRRKRGHSRLQSDVDLGYNHLTFLRMGGGQGP